MLILHNRVNQSFTWSNIYQVLHMFSKKKRKISYKAWVFSNNNWQCFWLFTGWQTACKYNLVSLNRITLTTHHIHFVPMLTHSMYPSQQLIALSVYSHTRVLLKIIIFSHNKILLYPSLLKILNPFKNWNRCNISFLNISLRYNYFFPL